MKKPKYTYKMARMCLPIIHMKSRKTQRYIDWVKVFILASCIAWWVGIIWLILAYKGGDA
jgi:hypothetical protein